MIVLAPRTRVVVARARGGRGPAGAPGGGGGAAIEVADRTALKAITGMAAGDVRWLGESGRQGLFAFDGGNLSGEVTADTLEGIYVAPDDDDTGAGGAWVRQWDWITAEAEWFGAARGLSVDCYAAINAALAHALVVQLKGGDYKTSATIKIPEHRKLRGAGSKYNDTTDEVTRLLVNTDDTPCIQLGPDAFPGTINDNWQGIWAEDIYIGRLINPEIAAEAPGVLVQYTLYGGLRNVKSAESMVGFRYKGTVGLRVEGSCEAVRAQAGTGAGTDHFVGHHVDGSADIGAAGGNASIVLDRPVTNCNLAGLQTAVGTAGILLDGEFGFTDAFIHDPESTHCRIAIQVEGNSATGNDLSQTNLFISHPVMDQFHHAGIYLNAIGEAGAVEITDPYCGPATDARACIWANGTDCSVSINGGMLVMGAAPDVQPFAIEGASRVTISPSTKVLEAGATYPVVGMDGASNCRIEPTVKNIAVTAAAVVALENTCSQNVIAPMISGMADAFTFGIQAIGTGDSANTYVTDGIDPACLDGGAAQMIVRNGVSVTAEGTTGTNRARGPNLKSAALHEQVIALSDETTEITSGAGKLTMHWPFDFTVEEVIIGLTTVSSSGAVTIDMNVGGASIFSTVPSIAAGEETNLTGTAAVIASPDIDKGDKVTFDFDAAGADATGAKAYVIGRRR